MEDVLTEETAEPRVFGPRDPIRVLVVDDHALFRRGLQMVLEQEEDIEVVGRGRATEQRRREGRRHDPGHRA
jgi:PleD family two-component response regulator